MERDSRALLLPHVLLAIGTLGHSHPPPLLLEKLEAEAEAEQHESEDDHQSESVDQDSTAIAAVVFHPSSINTTDELPKPPAAVEDLEKSSEPQVTAAEEEIVIEEPLLKEDKQNAELAQKRITLADLFAAEPAILAAAAAGGGGEKSEEEGGLKTQLKAAMSAGKKQADAGRSKKKKNKMKEKVEESLVPSAKKIHRLITRMLKKKIHPDGATRGGGEEPPCHGRKGTVVDCLHGGWSCAAGSVNLVNSC